MLCKLCKTEYTSNQYGEVCSEKCEILKIWIIHASEVKNEKINKYFVCDDELLLLIDEKQETYLRGMDGRTSYFNIGNNRVLMTTNLWHIGTIPRELRKYFPGDTKKINKLKNQELYIYTNKKLIKI